MEKILKKLSKFTAVLTSACLLVSVFGTNSYAVTVPQANIYGNIFNSVNTIINAESGKITSAYDAGSSKTVINIQDFHSHYQTQKNISEIIRNIDEKYKVKFVYTEGGYGNIDTSWIDVIKDEKLKNAVAEELVKEGELTGSEYYAIKNNKQNILKGADNEYEHKENIKRLNSIIERQNKYKEIIKKIEKEISVLNRIYVCARNKKFSRKAEEYEKGLLSAGRYYRYLFKYIKDIGDNLDKYNNITKINPEDYPNICKFINIKNFDGKINIKKVTAELATVINELKSKIPYSVYKEFLINTDNIKNTQKTVEYIELICEKADINIEYRYPDLCEFLKLNKANISFNPVSLVDEERKLIEQIRIALSYSGEEYEITYLSDFFKYFKEYLTYSLISEDWKYFKNSFKKFRKLYSKYACIDRITEIEQDFSELDKYYEVNEYRNNIFADNIIDSFNNKNNNFSKKF